LRLLSRNERSGANYGGPSGKRQGGSAKCPHDATKTQAIGNGATEFLGDVPKPLWLLWGRRLRFSLTFLVCVVLGVRDDLASATTLHFGGLA
jgi:hypothetical protein